MITIGVITTVFQIVISLAGGIFSIWCFHQSLGDWQRVRQAKVPFGSMISLIALEPLLREGCVILAQLCTLWLGVISYITLVDLDILSPYAITRRCLVIAISILLTLKSVISVNMTQLIEKRNKAYRRRTNDKSPT
jgi:hypothetical protein